MLTIATGGDKFVGWVADRPRVGRLTAELK
jgi:hypothetical protein